MDFALPGIERRLRNPRLTTKHLHRLTARPSLANYSPPLGSRNARPAHPPIMPAPSKARRCSSLSGHVITASFEKRRDDASRSKAGDWLATGRFLRPHRATPRWEAESVHRAGIDPGTPWSPRTSTRAGKRSRRHSDRRREVESVPRLGPRIAPERIGT